MKFKNCGLCVGSRNADAHNNNATGPSDRPYSTGSAMVKVLWRTPIEEGSDKVEMRPDFLPAASFVAFRGLYE
jgi:hypothetical protein